MSNSNTGSILWSSNLVPMVHEERIYIFPEMTHYCEMFRFTKNISGRDSPFQDSLPGCIDTCFLLEKLEPISGIDPI